MGGGEAVRSNLHNGLHDLTFYGIRKVLDSDSFDDTGSA